ncbi:MAG: metalloregulator ArsR/SmtB family transcription factor [Candidatus Eremiobacterota bacterium]
MIDSYADKFAALGNPARLQILRLLLACHPRGMVVQEILEELEMAGSTLSHHLEKLRKEGLATVEREGTYLRYRADTDALQELLDFLMAQCCSRGTAPCDRNCS